MRTNVSPVDRFIVFDGKLFQKIFKKQKKKLENKNHKFSMQRSETLFIFQTIYSITKYSHFF